ncbi:hypothetical protein TIFTF001_002614 [Ficus carica]|uniref:Uncharacterized protein n=1 Tax=Ficus carica TaxID=3494 RepID=A0AA87ZV75_FICCA|nr:hypothetical protein TIFTF001_002614 [Ficus carica]
MENTSLLEWLLKIIYLEKEKVVVSTSCSLLHTAVDLLISSMRPRYTKRSSHGFPLLPKKVKYSRDVELTQREMNVAVQQAAATLKDSDHHQVTNESALLDAQQKKKNNF